MVRRERRWSVVRADRRSQPVSRVADSIDGARRTKWIVYRGRARRRERVLVLRAVWEEALARGISISRRRRRRRLIGTVMTSMSGRREWRRRRRRGLVNGKTDLASRRSRVWAISTRRGSCRSRRGRRMLGRQRGVRGRYCKGRYVVLTIVSHSDTPSSSNLFRSNF